MQSETLVEEFSRLVREYNQDDGPGGIEAWNLIADFAVDNAEAIEAALSAAEPVSSHNDEAGYVEFLNQDVPYIVRDIQGAVAILMDLETRNVVGYRVYDPDSVFAPPAPSVAVNAEEINAIVEDLLDAQQDINLAANSTMDQSLCDASALIDRVETLLNRIKTAALSAQVQDVAGWQPIETAPHDTNVLLAWTDSTLPCGWKMEAGMASWGWRRDGVSNMSEHGQATHWMPLPAAPAKQEG